MDDVDKVVAIANKYRGRWKEIAEAADVSHSWLSQMARGLMEDSGSRRCQRVIEWDKTQDIG